MLRVTKYRRGTRVEFGLRADSYIGGMREFVLLLILVTPALFAQGQVGNCSVFPAKNIWNVPIDKLPVHPDSELFIATEGPGLPVFPDFGTKVAIPYSVVKGSKAKAAIQFTDGSSDPGPYPIPPNAPTEPTVDSHLIVVDQDACKLYEAYNAHANGDGTWTAGTGAVFDLTQNLLRPEGWSSADAAGLPIFAGLVRYDEVASGQIRHALRMTVPKTAHWYVWPARHYASDLDGEQYPPMGQRFRLKASYDISGFDPVVKVILQAMKTYGMMVADNGMPWYIQGAPDSRWNDSVLSQLRRVSGSDLEAVDVSSLQASPNSALAVDTNAPLRSAVPFSPTPSFDVSVAPTQSMSLTGDVNGSTVVNLRDGQTVSFLICQDTVGGHAFTWPSNMVGGMQVGMVAGTCSAQTFVSDGVKLYATGPGVTNM